MRILLVGTREERARFIAELADSSLTIVGEFATLADARVARIEADAVLLARRVGARVAASDDRVEWYEEPLTPRELEVVSLMADGYTNKAIAARLGISDQTVKFHVASIAAKLGAANRTDAVRRALRRGLVAL
jgi:DNA-binding NarL/FixJ family response regulator